MVFCEECGKKLGIIEGYKYPTLGKNFLLCSLCFDEIFVSVEKWKEFVLSNSLNSDFNTKNYEFTLKIINYKSKVKRNSL